MRPEQFAELTLEFRGHGMIDRLTLDEQFFTDRENEINSAIVEVRRVSDSTGGNYLNTALGGGIDGCLIEFDNGTIMTITYDGEYINVAVFHKE